MGLVVFARVIQLENLWTDLNEICLEVVPLRAYPKIVLFDILPLAITKQRRKELVRWARH
jgi:hypothetical protein